jgi:Cu/Ag efflux pump CusA
VFATGGVLSYGSFLGFAAVLAIAVRNGVLLVNRYQSLAMKPAGDELNADFAAFQPVYAQQSPLNDAGRYDGQLTKELVLEGTHERFVPIVLTATATALAFLPFVVFGNIPGHEIMQPMAVVVLGGLITSTLVSLYLLPALYLWLAPQPLEELAAEPTAVEATAAPAQLVKENGQPQLIN